MTPDKTKLLQLHNFFMNLPRGRFDMRYVMSGPTTGLTGNSDVPLSRLDECETAACVAGWTGYLFGKDDPAWDVRKARAVLGLEFSESTQLFTPPDYYAHPERFTPRGAAKTIRIFLMTGIMRWSEPAHVR